MKSIIIIIALFTGCNATTADYSEITNEDIQEVIDLVVEEYAAIDTTVDVSFAKEKLHTYTVNEVKSVLLHKYTVMGYIDFVTQEIFVRSYSSQSEKNRTHDEKMCILGHEYIHAVINAAKKEDVNHNDSTIWSCDTSLEYRICSYYNAVNTMNVVSNATCK